MFRILTPLLLLGIALPVLAEEDRKQPLFEKVFGNLVVLDPEMVEKVKNDEHGKRHYVDTDNDGKPQEVWFIDTDTRHSDNQRPVLVRVIDEDGDLIEGEEPDLDSDLYIADWNADGQVDSAVDYTDTDGDNDLDEMGTYFYDHGGATLGEPLIRVWWGRDVGDDNLLWFDVGYNYSQPLCQIRTHFGGDEVFVAFALKLTGNAWIPFWENPFQFYDHDGDGVSEEVFRNSGEGRSIGYLRHSFDADNDATKDSPRDYDCSLTAHAPEDLEFDNEVAERIVLRGIPTGPFLNFQAAPTYGRRVVWERMLLTWDEDDNNVDGDRYTDTDERWEGVIAKGNDDFKQVGGPSGGLFNKRNELSVEPAGPAEFYFLPGDRRIHLKDLDRAWMDVDYDYDREVDMKYTMHDTDEDGFLDEWRVDLDADGTIDDTWEIRTNDTLPVSWEWGEINSHMSRVMKEAPDQLFMVNEKLARAIIASTSQPPDDPMTRLFRDKFQRDTISPELALKLFSSRESLRFFLDLHKDFLIYQLKQAYEGDTMFWKILNQARSHSNFALLNWVLNRDFDFPPPAEGGFDEWQKKRIDALRTKRVAWAEDWVPPNIGWESDRIAYRAYWGQFDFFGKTGKDLLYPTIGEQSYHEETEWGIDALLVGDSPGCGGVTLYINDAPYPVWAAEGKSDIVFEKRLVHDTRDSVMIEMKAKGVGPVVAPYDVTFNCVALAGQTNSPIQVTVTGGKEEDKLELGVGLVKLPVEELQLDTATGVLSTWGSQTPVIGTIGMGVLFPPKKYGRFADLAGENQVVLDIQREQPVVYHIQCYWLRGRRFNRSPTSTNWFEELKEKAQSLRLR